MSDHRSPNDESRTDLRSWLIVAAIAGSFLLWGLFVFKQVGDKGTATWDFGAVADIPGESPYSTYRQNPIFGTPPPLAPQHVPGVTKEPGFPTGLTRKDQNHVPGTK